MSSVGLIRRAGTAAVLSGTLFVICDLLDLAVAPAAADSGGFGADAFAEGSRPGALLVVQSGLTLLAGVLLLFGLIGLYARRSEEVGLLGLFGFVTAFAGTVMAIGGFWANAFVAPSLAHALAQEASGLMDATPPRSLSAGFTLSYGLVAAGWSVFGLAVLASRAYPRPAAGLLMVGAALSWLPVSLSGMVFGVAVAWLGSTLISDAGVPSEEPHHERRGT